MESKLKLFVTSLYEAMEIEPEENTAIIRIFGHSTAREINEYPLEHSEDFETILTYVFNDIDPEIDYVAKSDMMLAFTEDIAYTIIDDFKEEILDNDIEVLYLHCYQGQRRSPAIAMALNEIFKLENDDTINEFEFPDYNQYVYNTLLAVAEQNGDYVKIDEY